MFLRITKYVAIAFAGIAIFMAGGLWYAQTHASQWAKKYSTEFGQNIGYLIDFNDLNIEIKRPKISISGLKIVDLMTTHQLLELKNIQVSASWGGLIGKKIVIDQVHIDQAHILAEKQTENWNWLQLIEAIQKKFPPKENKQASTPKAFLVKEVLFKDGSLKLNESSIQFTTEFKPFNFELKNTSNTDSRGGVGGFESGYGIDLGNVIIPFPKEGKKLDFGHVQLRGDFDLDSNQNIVVNTKVKIEDGSIDAMTQFDKVHRQIQSNIQLDRLSLVPFLDFAIPKVPRSEKTGLASGQLQFTMQDTKNIVDGELSIENINLAPLITLAPTVNTIYAKSGGAAGKFKLHYDPENTQVEGNIQVNQLGIFESDKTSELLGWRTAKVEKFYFEENPKSQKLRVEDVKVDGLKGRFVIYGDKSSNFRRMFQPSHEEIQRIEKEKENLPLQKKESNKEKVSLNLPKGTNHSNTYSSSIQRVKSNSVISEQSNAEDEPSSTTNTSSSKKPMNLNMKSIEITNGLIEFSDFSVKPNFKTDIENFHGTLIGVSTYPKRYATGAFEGVIPPSGDMKLKAKIAFEDPRRNNDINLSFRRIPLASINPYYTTFAGYEVKGGTLSYDSRFITQDAQLNGDNRFIINQMQIGDKVADYKGKDIPLGLIVALLEDENGVIDLNLKVEGNVDKPDFKIGDLIWDAVWTIVGNVASAPFKALGRLIGIEGHTGIYFEPGKSSLRPSESLKLENLVAGLQKRPKTKLNINGVYDPKADQFNLNTEKVDREIFKTAGFKLADGEPLPQLPLEDERVQRAIRKMYTTTVGMIPADLKLKDGPSGIEAWSQLHNHLVAKGNVTEDELRVLANSRALNIKNEILKLNKGLDERMRISEAKEQSIDKDGIPVGIELVAN